MLLFQQSNKDYKMLEETKAKVENHMHALERQVELLHETQRENISLQSMLSNLENQLEEKESLVESLKKENQTLALQSTASLNESANLHQQLANANFSRGNFLVLTLNVFFRCRNFFPRPFNENFKFLKNCPFYKM